MKVKLTGMKGSRGRRHIGKRGLWQALHIYKIKNNPRLFWARIKNTLRMSDNLLTYKKPCILLHGPEHRYTAVILGLRWDRFFARLQNLRIDLKTDLEASSTVNVGDGGRHLWRMCISPWRMGKTKIGVL